jgi:hypothetical protein
MKVAIMQPYFFPYIGYISLIKHTDKFILFDPVQYIRHGWIDRNRILKQNDGWLYIQVPLLNKNRDTLIKDLLIDNNQDWKEKIIAQLQIYKKKKAPNFFKVVDLIKTIFSKDFTNIVELNKIILITICDYLGVKADIEVFSEMNLDIKKVNAPDEWALNICKALGNIDEYWNPPGGQSFFNKEKYDASGITLYFQNVNLLPYNQNNQLFEAGLSILDVLMFNSIVEINSMLNDYELL